MYNFNNDLKISIETIRKSIDTKKTTWKNRLTTNCYSYALGIDIPEAQIKEHAFCPGNIANAKTDLSNYNVFKYDDLIHNLYLDFKTLGIICREVKSNETIKDNECKIALFVNEYLNLLEDFHFLREQNGIWFHKNGYVNDVTKYDDHGFLIINPEECFLRHRKYKTCFSLSLD